MEIQRFDAKNSDGKDRYFMPYGKKLYQRTIDSFNEQGYKLYYYKDFNLNEIKSIDKAIKKQIKCLGVMNGIYGTVKFFS